MIMNCMNFTRPFIQRPPVSLLWVGVRYVAEVDAFVWLNGREANTGWQPGNAYYFYNRQSWQHWHFLYNFK